MNKKKLITLSLYTASIITAITIPILSISFPDLLKLDIETSISISLLSVVVIAMAEFRFNFLDEDKEKSLLDQYQKTENTVIRRYEATESTIIHHYKEIENRILKALNLALGSNEISASIHKNVVQPTEILIGHGSLLQDHPIINLLLDQVYEDVGKNIQNSLTLGLKIPGYLQQIEMFTGKAKTIRAVSLLVPSIFLKNENVQGYVETQKKLLLDEKEPLEVCERVFIFDEKYDDPDDWKQLVELHDPINVRKYTRPDININDHRDFVIYDDYYVVESDTLKDQILSNNIRSKDDMVNKYIEIEPLMSGNYIFDPIMVKDSLNYFNNFHKIGIS